MPDRRDGAAGHDGDRAVTTRNRIYLDGLCLARGRKGWWVFDSARFPPIALAGPFDSCALARDWADEHSRDFPVARDNGWTH